eukprot:TRINITY_DN56810_c0_g1_i1.p1 TRINITY_DN56810_c0_g1~~TRINITY_DN56810_c0_g1_i1.p1  ORF type:complete len:184 (+),score=45.41 TRINITY_DN56810_c0_g1_i1:60-611(+)
MRPMANARSILCVLFASLCPHVDSTGIEHDIAAVLGANAEAKLLHRAEFVQSSDVSHAVSDLLNAQTANKAANFALGFAALDGNDDGHITEAEFNRATADRGLARPRAIRHEEEQDSKQDLLEKRLIALQSDAAALLESRRSEQEHVVPWRLPTAVLLHAALALILSSIAFWAVMRCQSAQVD